MKSEFLINGMTCSSCEKKVKDILSKINGVEEVTINLQAKRATLISKNSISDTQIVESLKPYPKYSLEKINSKFEVLNDADNETKTWVQTYKPVLLIFIYLILIASIYEFVQKEFITIRWMNHFMAGFFIIFSFFKLLNISAFANSYAMYDIVAKKINIWGYIYPFVELLLGLSFLFNYNSKLTNWVTIIVMSISLIGVLQSVLNKKKIKCACLGNVFDLPMSTITIVEDGLMILMSLYMLIQMYLM